MAFQDEKWVDLLPRVWKAWAPKGSDVRVPTLGYTKRVNCFITLFWPRKNIITNCFSRRRNIEFRKHLSNIVAYAKRHRLKKVILFIDDASYHKTPQVEKFVRQHPVLSIKTLPGKDPNSNPVECLVNKRLASAVCVNRCHEGLAALKLETKKFLRMYNSIYAT